MSPPLRLGKYEIRRELGKGSMGIVYEGFDPMIERRVAIKVVRDDQLDSGQMPELLARLKREAQAAGRLNHPGIVAVYDYGEEATLHGTHVAYIAMELIDGGDLKSLFDSGRRFTPTETARWMRDILGALGHAHERGVTHRDVKPSNIMLLAGDRIKIADFGIARLESSELTRTGSVVGTPQYMAPEQLLGLAVDGRSDLFACGVILYQFLTGAKPFSGSYATVMQKILNEEPAPPTQLNQDLAPAWDRVLRKAMAKKPAERYQNAAEFAAAIDAALHDADDKTAVLPQADEATIAWPTMSAKPAVDVPSTPAMPPRRRLGLGVLAALAAVVVAALGGWAHWRNGDRGPQPAVASAPAAKAASSEAMRMDGASQPAAAPMVPIVPAPMPVPKPVPGLASEPAASTTSRSTAQALAKPAAQASVASATAPRSGGAASAPPRAPSAALTVAATSRPAGPPSPPPPDPSPPPATAGVAAAAAPYAAQWRARRAALDNHRPPPRMSLTMALGLLLDLDQDSDRRLVHDVEALLQQQPGSASLVMGVVDGQLALAWRNRPNPAQSLEAARRRCLELRALGCSVVWGDGEFRPRGLAAVAGLLGERSVADVRAGLMRVLERALSVARAAPAASMPAAAVPVAPAPPDSSPRPAQTPSPTTTSSPSQREWAQAVAALHALPGRPGLGRALAVLLQARAPDELDTLSRFEAAMKRLPWKSALAMGERQGEIVYRWAQRESKPAWAADSAINACSRAASAPCTIVMADGETVEGGLRALAARLGSKPQPLVREALLRQMRRTLASGI